MRPMLALQPAHIRLDARTASGATRSTPTARWSSTPSFGFALETQTLDAVRQLWFTAYTQGTWDADDGARARARVVRQQRLAVRVERPLAQRGPRELVRVPVSPRSTGASRSDTEYYPDPSGLRDGRGADEGAIYAHGDEWRAENGPVARPLAGDATTLFRFQRLPRRRARALRAAPEGRPRGVRSASSAPASTASATARRAPTTSSSSPPRSPAAATSVPFLRDWVYGTKTPPMPGHPDWTTNPPGTARRSRRVTAPRAR